MNAFRLHIIITVIIFTILAVGFKFFLKLIGTLDFSYMGIVMFGAYAATLLHLHRGRGILASMGGAFVIALPFTLLVMYLSTKLSDLYFAIGTLTFYVLMYQLAFNLESVTQGAFGLTSIGRNLIGGVTLSSLESFFWFAAIALIILFIALFLFKRTYFFHVLQAWGEEALVIKSLGVKVSRYVLTMIAVTTLLAVIGGSMFAFYYRYIDPPSFWISMLTILMTISFLSYKYNERITLLIGGIVIFGYEYLRFFKVVDPSKLGYLREMLFTLLIIVVAFVVFRRLSFRRQQ